MRSKSRLTVVLFAVSAQPAFALDLGSFTATATLTTDYRFRGVSQNGRAATVQGELDLAGPDDWSASVSASKVNFADHENTSIEFAFYGSKHIDWHDIGADISLNYYAYPDHYRARGGPRYSSLELIADVSRTWGDLTVGGTGAWSPNYFSDGPAWYVAGNTSYRIADWLSASATVGEQGAPAWDGIHASGYPYLHWDAGVVATFGEVSVDARYVGSSLSSRACLLTQGGTNWCAASLVLSISYRVSSGHA